MDPLAVHLAMDMAARRLRSGEGPVVIEALVYRFFHQNGPFPGSAFGYRTRQEEAAWRARDPLERVAAEMTRLGLIDEAGIAAVRAQAAGAMRQAAGQLLEPDDGREGKRRIRPALWPDPAFTDVGDPVGSGIALANGMAFFTTTVSNKLVALDTASGQVLKEIPLGPVWCGPSVSRGRVYVGSGNILFAPFEPKEAYFPKRLTGTLYSFGLQGDDEVGRMGKEN